MAPAPPVTPVPQNGAGPTWRDVALRALGVTMALVGIVATLVVVPLFKSIIDTQASIVETQQQQALTDVAVAKTLDRLSEKLTEAEADRRALKRRNSDVRDWLLRNGAELPPVEDG